MSPEDIWWIIWMQFQGKRTDNDYSICFTNLQKHRAVIKTHPPNITTATLSLCAAFIKPHIFWQYLGNKESQLQLMAYRLMKKLTLKGGSTPMLARLIVW